MSPMAWKSGLWQEPVPPPSYICLGCGWKMLGAVFAPVLLRSGWDFPLAESVAEEVTGWSKEQFKS